MTEAKPKTTGTKYPNLAAALVAFQADIPVPRKDSTADTGKFSYDYASLDKLTPVIFEKLTAVGIAYSAAPDLTELGFGLRAQLIHESGESIGGFYPLGSPNNPAQTIGSAITYARRYALLALTGVAPEGTDDDGAKATEAQGKVLATAATATASGKESPDSVRAEMGAIIEGSGGTVTGEDANDVMAEVTGNKPAANWTLTDLKKGRDALKALVEARAK